MIGLGNPNAIINIYLENRPPLPYYQALGYLVPMQANEISTIATQTGNHWRKIFNVLAKLAFMLNNEGYKTWQELRDKSLLQQGSPYALVFSAPDFTQLTNIKPANNTLHLVMGKTYAHKLALAETSYWLDPYFALNKNKKLIICPYFDYRQLSNIKIQQLVGLIQNNITAKTHSHHP